MLGPLQLLLQMHIYYLNLLIPLFLSLLSKYYISYTIPSSYFTSTIENPLNILILTAHPDDECMFFAPTILALTGSPTDDVPKPTSSLQGVGGQAQHHNAFSLCLSSGDADGLGETRKHELAGSLDVLGIPEGRRWVLDEPFKDNITAIWDADLIAEYVKPYIVEHKIDIVLTFDERGISSHPNHVSLAHGARALVSKSTQSKSSRLRAFSLVTVPLLPKYTGQISALLKSIELRACELFKGKGGADAILGITNLCSSTKESSFISGHLRHQTAVEAMKQHRSQLVWFRWLYISFSRYMWVNDWVEILPDR